MCRTPLYATQIAALIMFLRGQHGIPLRFRTVGKWYENPGITLIEAMMFIV